MAAALRHGVHYTDLTGEVDVFERAFDLHEQAVQAGITMMPGVGFDVVPTDSAARLATDMLGQRPESLDLAFVIDGPTSGGTAMTLVDVFPAGVRVRRGGVLVTQAAGTGVLRRDIAGTAHTLVPMTWGDLSTAYHSTGAPNITAYMASPPGLSLLMRLAVPPLRLLLRGEGVRLRLGRWLKRLIGEVKTFAGDEPQVDDMICVAIKVED